MMIESTSEDAKHRHEPHASSRFLDALGQPRQVFVVSHANPDPDALASMMAVEALVQGRWPGLPTTLVLDGIVARAENQRMVQALNIPLTPIDELHPETDTAVVMVDTQPGNNARLSIAPRAVLDHHETPGQLAGVPYRDIRPDLGATTTLLTHYLREQKILVDRRLATALFYGIESETTGWPRESSPKDDAALEWLYPRIDRDRLAEIRNPRLPQSYFATFQHALTNAFLYNDVIFAYGGILPQPDIVAELADFFIRFDQVSWSVVCGVYGQTMRLSARTDHIGGSCGEVLREAVNGMGSAGGHDRRAGGLIVLPDLNPLTIDRALTEIRGRIIRCLGTDITRGHRLLESCPRIATP